MNEFKITKNYGPQNLVENTQLLQQLSKDDFNNEFTIPISKENLFAEIKRNFVTLFFNVHKIARRLKS